MNQKMVAISKRILIVDLLPVQHHRLLHDLERMAQARLRAARELSTKSAIVSAVDRVS